MGRAQPSGEVNVLVVIDSLAPGGAEKSTMLLADRMRKAGIRTTIAVLGPAEHSMEDRASSLGIDIVRFETTGLFGLLRALRRYIKSTRPDVVHTILYRSDQIGRVAAWRSGARVISSLVNTPYTPADPRDAGVPRWKERVVREIDSLTARIVVDRMHAVSEGTRSDNAQALRFPIERITVVERGRSPESFEAVTDAQIGALRFELGVPDGAPLVLNLARQDQQKGQIDLVNAMRLLLDTRPETVVVIAGKPGTASSGLRQVLEDHPQLRDHVRLIGHRDDAEVLLKAADALVISSRYEGTAGAALEAMAAGTPIVSTRLTGLAGILVDGENAVLTASNDPGGIAQAIERLLSDPDLVRRIVAGARRDFGERFTLEASADKMARLYRELTNSADVARVS